MTAHTYKPGERVEVLVDGAWATRVVVNVTHCRFVYVEGSHSAFTEPHVRPLTPPDAHAEWVKGLKEGDAIRRQPLALHDARWESATFARHLRDGFVEIIHSDPQSPFTWEYPIAKIRPPQSKPEATVCSKCGAAEVESLSPRTRYACGSSDYDQRPGTCAGECQSKPEVSDEDPAEMAYWNFDARRKGYATWKHCPQSERDAFKAEYRGVSHAEYDALAAKLAESERARKCDATITDAQQGNLQILLATAQRELADTKSKLAESEQMRGVALQSLDRELRQLRYATETQTETARELTETKAAHIELVTAVQSACDGVSLVGSRLPVAVHELRMALDEARDDNERLAANLKAKLCALDEAKAALCDLALEALELRALVPTDEEIKTMRGAASVLRGFIPVHASGEWLDRVRAWKGSQ